MRLNSARTAWHDCYYQRWDSVMSHAIDLAKLGTYVQTTEKQRSATKAVHQCLAGMVQRAIGTLPVSLQQYGHFLYSPMATADHQEIAHEVVWSLIALPEMRQAKRDKAYWLVRSALFSYSRMVWGNDDPLDTPAKVVDWLNEQHGVALDRTNWHRDWADLHEQMLRICDRLDKLALAPVATAISEMRQAA